MTSAMRSPSTTTEPGLSTRSGRTISAPASTIMPVRSGARQRRQHGRADCDAVLAERRDLESELFDDAGRQSARALLLDGIEEQIPGAGRGATEDDDFGIDRTRQVRHRHADVFCGVTDDGNRHAVSGAGPLEYVR